MLLNGLTTEYAIPTRFLRSAKFIKVATVVKQPYVRQTDYVCFEQNFFSSTILPKAHVVSLPSRIPTQLSRRSQMFVQWFSHVLRNSYGVIRNPKFLKVAMVVRQPYVGGL